MTDQTHYVAAFEDDEVLRDRFGLLGLHVLPEGPGKPAGLSPQEVSENRRRLLSLKPIEAVTISQTNPYPHYSSTSNPLIEWDVPTMTEQLLITGYLRYFPRLAIRGAAFVEIERAYKTIRKWMRENWRAINELDFMGPRAAELIESHGFTWSCFDPRRTTFSIVGKNGEEKSVGIDEWRKGD